MCAGSDGSGAQVLLGSHPEYALSESLASLQEQRLLFHCCVGPDSVYENAANKYMYGVQVLFSPLLFRSHFPCCVAVMALASAAVAGGWQLHWVTPCLRDDSPAVRDASIEATI